MANFFERQRAALVRLAEAARARAAAEAELAACHASAVERAERDVGRARRANAAGRQKDLGEMEAGAAAATAESATTFDSERAAVERRHAERRAQLAEGFSRAHEKAKTEYKDRLWTVDSVLEAGQKRAQERLDDLTRKVAAGEARVAGLWDAADPLLGRVGLTRGDVQPRSDPCPPEGEPDAVAAAAIDAASAERDDLAALSLPKLARVKGLVLCVAAVAVVAAAASFPFFAAAAAAAVAAGVAVTSGVGLWLLLKAVARRQALRQGQRLAEQLAVAESACDLARVQARNEHDADRKRLAEQHAVARKQTEDHYVPHLDTQKRRSEAEQKKIDAERTASVAAIHKQQHGSAESASRTYTDARKRLEGRYEGELAGAEATYAGRTAEAAAARDATWERTAADWRTTLSETTAELHFLSDAGARLFPDWGEGGTAETAPLSEVVPDGVPYGTMAVDLRYLPDGESADERLWPAEPLALRVPAYLPFPDRCALVLKARDEGRAASVAALQAIALRFLTGLPPGKVRFTIVDPVGLGENFAAFMHLADHDEKLVTGQIWTEQGQIEKRLVDLTDHIAAVIQKYLRNQYKSIEEYNRVAGEVAEPYRVLIAANFPAGFTPEAARRLVSIANSGPSCGVCTLVGVDSRMAVPRDFQMADLEAASLTLQWKDGAFHAKDPALDPFPLSIEAPPGPTAIAKLVQRVGKASLTAGRVEVPFEYIRPPRAEVWSGDASRGFDVPIGRAGATRRQSFRLGRGTAQHALIAGKTGSGKSTLLHAIIGNLGLIYSPEEAELYLIDFKKGVEFKDYATYRLPQARVVAIESEREFGLSVLQRLDGVLRERGDRFRDAGVNDLAGYREHLKRQAATRPDAAVADFERHCPRILLIVDEFQEFFVEDDKLAQEAALLMDRLVRQGRAFGLHVVLGSQTLGGAFSLARTTIDQMAVRIALQSSEADAQLILSKDNNAARLLSRPGEAIYNDANGLVEGNDPFQVVWIAEGERERVLEELREKAGDRYPPPLVFEGNRASDISENVALARALSSPPASQKAVAAWLGDPVAIKEPTAAVFRPQGAANLLAIGQQEDTARAVFGAALIGLAAQVAVGAACPAFTVLDGTPEDVDEAEALRNLARKLPVPAATPNRAELGAALGVLAVELERRQKGESAERTPLFLFVFGIHRFRELRKAEDDFGFRRGAERQVSPAESFATLIREGPPLGIHALVWCDSLTNLNRSFDRQALREFGMRVLFQMSPTDSSTLVDSPVASRLGKNRALYLQEEQERAEKFRPYGWPSDGWVGGAVEKLRSR